MPNSHQFALSNCGGNPYGLIVELVDEAKAVDALTARLAPLPQAHTQKWMAILARSFGEKLTKEAAERLVHA